MSTKTVSIDSSRYADADDCLVAAAADYAAKHGLDGWQVEARWEDTDTRETILLTVPAN